VTTVEGIGGMRQGLHPVQQRIAVLNGSQCGFCTPGIVMSVYAQLRENPDATPHELEESLDGNLCRCTGYRPIIDAARSLSNNKGTGEGEGAGAGGGGCCRGGGGCAGCPCKEKNTEEEEKDKQHSCSDLHESKEGLSSFNYTEPIFPPALMRYKPEFLCIASADLQWFQPVTLPQVGALSSGLYNAVQWTV
jgi:xanthine dehydrogenase/oxidase